MKALLTYIYIGVLCLFGAIAIGFVAVWTMALISWLVTSASAAL